MTPWTVPFVVAAATSLAVTPILRRLALAIDFVDRPSTRKSHTESVAYMGGVAVVVATCAGAIVGPFTGARTYLLLGGGALLSVVGLADDRRHLGPSVRLLAQLAMAGAAYVAGIRAVATGVPTLDLLITVLWIAGMANSLNFFDNMDGLATGTAVVAAISLFFLAALGGQYRIATLAIALAGACLGFLGFNFRPATIYMGDAGSLFLGFILSTLTLQVAPSLGPPGSFAVPLLLLGVPLLDTTTVILGRLRHGQSPLQGGKDHLSHRLVTQGRSREVAVVLLIAAQAAMGALAVLIGRNVIGLPIALAGGLLVVALLMPAATKRGMYSERRQRLPRALVWTVVGLALLLGLAAIPAALGLWSSRNSLQAGGIASEQAISAGQVGDAEGAAALFLEANAHFRDAGHKLGGPVRAPGLIVPGLASNLRAGRVLASTGQALSAAGTEITTSADPEDLAISGGRVDLEALQKVTPQLLRAARVLRTSRGDIRELRLPYLLPEVQDAINRLDRRLSDALGDADRAAAAARALPSILGGKGDRRYFIAVQNNAESRATGGFIGNFGELVSEDGGIRLDRFGRIGELNAKPGEDRALLAPEDFGDRYARFDVANLWQNVNLSPDLPTVAKVIADLYPRSGGQEVDGVITVDPVGLSGLLRLTGPVTVPAWETPITADNVVDVTLKEAYIRFPDQEQRVAFLGDVARAVVSAATTGALGSPRQIVDALSGPARSGHLQVTMLDDAEDEVMRRVKLSGHVPNPAGDSLLLTTQNAAGNKIDTFLKRTVTYDLDVTPPVKAGRAKVEGTVTITLTNQAPAAGLPPAIIGPYEPRFAIGENRTFISLYTPLALEKASIDGQVTGLESGRELGRNVYSTFLSIPSRGTATVVLDVAGTVALDEFGRYQLDVLRQPLLTPDEVVVNVTAGAGWQIGPALDEVERTSATGASARFSKETPTRIRVGLVDATPRTVVQRLLRPS